MALVHAKLEIVTPLALGKGAAPLKQIDVQFNPNEYSIVRNVSYADVNVPGLQMPLLQFVRGETQTLSVELYLDASDRVPRTPGGVPTGASDGVKSLTKPFEGLRGDLEQLRKLVTIDKELHAPPVVRFVWGSVQFQGVVAQLTEKFQMFDDRGNVLRARVTLQLKSYVAPKIQSQIIDQQSPDRTKTRVVREGERIDLIALEEYGDAARWPAIARANRLRRPRILAAGTVLLIPPL